MKNTSQNIIFLGVLVASSMLFSQETKILKSDMPNEISRYVNFHFPKENIVKITRENKATHTEYALRLDNDTELEFDNNIIKEIESTSKLPESVIPPNILNYVSKNFPDTFIIEWKINYTKQKIELNNGKKLEFTKKGEFLRIE